MLYRLNAQPFTQYPVLYEAMNVLFTPIKTQAIINYKL